MENFINCPKSTHNKFILCYNWLKQNKKQKIGYFIAFEGQTVICGWELGGSSCCVCMAQQSYYKLAYTVFNEKNQVNSAPLF